MNPLAFSWFDFHLFNVSKVADREPEDDITHYYHTSQLVGDCEMSDSWPRGTWQLTASEYGVLLDELDRLQLLQDTHVSSACTDKPKKELPKIAINLAISFVNFESCLPTFLCIKVFEARTVREEPFAPGEVGHCPIQSVWRRNGQNTKIHYINL
jgi:hypothetical protein